ncbi:N-acetylneuraminate synthase family protein [Desulfopila sp. IMCC35008]|uniref:N-acetylneuraminate synthase family protein n=1 Tax=Desulfopila sp. IMCC35008 TaxID=2653858 RepID=UPI0013D06ABE|nr:N-acetylneuraminate synthase family protein [Desulfopila sp. IMCC35008]
MIIDREISKYIVFSEDPIVRGLEKMDANNMRIIFIVSETGVLEGIVSDGDVRRWLIEKQNNTDIQKPIIDICNKSFEYSSVNEHPADLSKRFSSRIEYVPLVDDKFHLIAIASKRVPSLIIDSTEISNESNTFIIAEIGNNHNGDIAFAKKLVDAAVDAGADCVKFQMRDLTELYSNTGNANDAKEDLGSQYVLDLLSKYQLSNDELIEIFDYCKQVGTIPLCTPWDQPSIDFLDEYGMQAFKIASADFTNHDFLKSIAEKGKVMICSTGMCNEQEVKAGVDILKRIGAKFILLHCNSTYPAPFKDINLNYLDRLGELSPFPVGYSGHERGGSIAQAAVAKGAKVIEKHFTLDRSMEGNDHKISLLPHEFKEMVQGIRSIELALGTSGNRDITQGELINRESLAKSLVINQELKKGERILEGMVEVKSPGKGLAPYKKNELIGLEASRDFKKGDFFYPEDIEGLEVEPRDFKFTHRYGVPVRYHDAVQIASSCSLDLLEIHLSYKDLEEDFEKFFSEAFSHDLVVHSPELFEGDHILDLCTPDHDYRSRSITELQRVVDITRKLKSYFPSSDCPLIVLNPGGFSADGFIAKEVRKEYYEILIDSLNQVDQDGVEIIPQTMPPYPWHFGGQRFHNLFIDSSEILDFCTSHGFRICLDLSHSKLACNFTKYPFSRFIEDIAHVTAHMHIADAKGLDGEGLQIGDGEIDFGMLMKVLQEKIPHASFIPEIWQGHKNGGKGFWIALDHLEKYS